MATQTLAYRPRLAYESFVKAFGIECHKLLKSLIPRPRMLLSAGLILVGLGIPFLMGLGLIPSSLLLDFVGLAFTGTGGVLALYFLSEI